MDSDPALLITKELEPQLDVTPDNPTVLERYLPLLKPIHKFKPIYLLPSFYPAIVSKTVIK